LPPPALGERRRRGLACRLIAVSGALDVPARGRVGRGSFDVMMAMTFPG